MTFSIEGAARPRSADIIDRLAAEHKVQPAVIEAVIKVESGGKAFAAGRPIILPERHKVYALLPAQQRAAAVKARLAAPKRSKANYADIGSQAKRWDFLARVADAYGAEIACKATSWGLPQIMGFNHAMCGFKSAEAMAEAFAEGEDEQISAMMAFIASAGLMDELRSLDWAGFARGYNGAGYRDNKYDTKLADAFAASQRKRLVAVKPSWQVKAERDGEAVLRLGSTGADVKALQEKLNSLALGISVATDGDFGPATKRAVVAFQSGRGLKVDGMVGPATRAAIDAAIPEDPRPVSRAQVVVESPAAQRSLGGAVIGGAAVVTTGARVVAETITVAPDPLAVTDVTTTIDAIGKTVDPVEKILGFVEAHPLLLLSIACAIICWLGFERVVKATRARNGVQV